MANPTAKIIIAADDSAAMRALRNVQKGADNLRSRIDGLGRSAVGLTGSLSAMAAIGIGAKILKDTANFADDMGKAAQKVGTTTEALSALKYAGDLADVSFEQLQVGLAKLAKNAEDFRDGSKSAADAFAKINLNPSRFKDTGALFEAVAQELSKMPDGARKTAIAMELLGKSGAQLIPLMNGGAAGIAKAREEAERLGLIMTGEAAKAAEDFNDNLTRLNGAVTGLKFGLGKSLLPAMQDIVGAMTDAAKEGGILDAIWVGLGATMANILGVDAASQAKKRLDEVNEKIKTVSKQLASGSLNPEGASEKFFSFLIPDVQLTEKAKAKLRQALKELEKERDNMVASSAQASEADKIRADQMAAYSEKSAEAKEMELRRLNAVFLAQKKGLEAAEKDLETAKKKREQVLKEFTDLKTSVNAPAQSEIFKFNVEKAIADARRAQEAAAKAPAGEADRMAEAAIEKARAAGELLKQYKAQEDGTGSSIDAAAAEEFARTASDQLLKIADAASKTQEQVAASQVAAMQKVIQDTLTQAEALKNIEIGFNQETAKASLDQMMEMLRVQAQQSPLLIPATVVTGSLPGNVPGFDDLPKKAYGGVLPGSSPHDRADNILYWGTAGEGLVNRPAMRHYGKAFLDAINTRRLPRFADGGVLGRVSVPSVPSASRASGMDRGTFNFPFGSYELSAPGEEISRLQRDLAREALKRGHRG